MLTNAALTGLSASSTSGWLFSNVSAPIISRAPYGTWDFTWTKTGYGDVLWGITCASDLLDTDAIKFFMETSVVHIWRAESRFSYSPNGETISGTTTADNTTTINGAGTNFTAELTVGSLVSVSSDPNVFARVIAITSDTVLEVDTALGDGSTQTMNTDKLDVTSWLERDGGIVTGGVYWDVSIYDGLTLLKTIKLNTETYRADLETDPYTSPVSPDPGTGTYRDNWTGTGLVGGKVYTVVTRIQIGTGGTITTPNTMDITTEMLFTQLQSTVDEKLDTTLSKVEENVVGAVVVKRSEERRVGKECRSRWSPYH